MAAPAKLDRDRQSGVEVLRGTLGA